MVDNEKMSNLLKQKLIHYIHLIRTQHDIQQLMLAYTEIESVFQGLSLTELMNGIFSEKNKNVRDWFILFFEKESRWHINKDMMSKQVESLLKKYKDKKSKILCKLLMWYFIKKPIITIKELLFLLENEQNWFFRRTAILMFDITNQNKEYPILLYKIALNDADWSNRYIAIDQLIKIGATKELKLIKGHLRKGKIKSNPSSTLDGRSSRKLLMEIAEDSANQSLFVDILVSDDDKKIIKKRLNEVVKYTEKIIKKRIRNLLENYNSNPFFNYNKLLLVRIELKEKRSDSEKKLVEIIHYIKTGERTVEGIAEELRKIDFSGAIPDLLHLLVNPSERNEANERSMKILELLEVKEAIPYLIEILKISYRVYTQKRFLFNMHNVWLYQLGEKAIDSLGVLKAVEAIPYLKMALLNIENNTIMRKTTQTLGKLGTKEAVDALIAGLSKEDVPQSHLATIFRNVGKSKYTSISEELTKSLRFDFKRLRLTIIKVIKEANVKKAIPKLIDVLINEPVDEVRVEAANALADMDVKEAIPKIRGLLKHKKRYVVNKAEQALFKLEKYDKIEEWKKELTNFLFTESPIKREQLIEILKETRIKCSEIFLDLYQEVKKHSKLSFYVSKLENSILEDADDLIKELMDASMPAEIRFHAYMAAGSLNMSILDENINYRDYIQELEKEIDPTIQTLIAIIEFYNPDSYLEQEQLGFLLSQQAKKTINVDLLLILLLKMLNYYAFVIGEFDDYGYFKYYEIVSSLIELLLNIKRKEAVPILTKIYYSNIKPADMNNPCDKDIIINAFNAIVDIDPLPAKEMILEAINDSCWQIIETAIDACGKHQFSEVIQELKEMRPNVYSDEYPDNFYKVIDEALLEFGIPVKDKCYSFVLTLVYDESEIDNIYNEDVGFGPGYYPDFSKEETLRIIEMYIKEMFLYRSSKEQIAIYLERNQEIVVIFSRIFTKHPDINLESIVDKFESSNEKETAMKLLSKIHMELDK